MRTAFQVQPVDPAQFIRDAVIVPDTNVLLGLYRLSPGAQQAALDALQAVGDRLWLPYQVGEEFYRNVGAVRGELRAAYDAARQALANAQKAALTPFGSGQRHQDSRNGVTAAVGQAVAALLSELDQLRNSDSAIVDPDHDQVLQQVEALFEGRVAPRPPVSAVRERVMEFATYRQPNQIPPGYLDARKSTPRLEAGDYLLWCEVLSLAADPPARVLLVTDDVKEDWYVHGSKPLVPRAELVYEFMERGGAGYHQVTLADFVRLTEHLDSRTVDAEIVDELDQARRESVEQYRDLDDYREALEYLDLTELAHSAAPLPGERGPQRFDIDRARLRRAFRGWADATARLGRFFETLEPPTPTEIFVSAAEALRAARDVSHMLLQAEAGEGVPEQALYSRARRTIAALELVRDRAVLGLPVRQHVRARELVDDFSTALGELRRPAP